MPYTETMPLNRGWAVVIACGIIASFSWGLGFHGLGLYLRAHGPRGLRTGGVVTMAAAVALIGVITTSWQLFAVYLVMAPSRGPRGAARAS